MTDGHMRAARTSNAWVAAIALAAGVGATVAGPSPTGSEIIDAVLLMLSVSSCVWLIATASWVDGWQGSNRPIITAIGLGVAIQVLTRLGNIWRLGFTAALAVVPILVVTLVAIHRRTGLRRLQLWSAFGGLVLAGVLALVGIGLAAAAARPNLTDGTDTAKAALRALNSGDFDSARAGFQTAADLLGGAVDDLDTPWAQPARLVPVVAQHRRAASELAKSAEAASDTIAEVLGEIDFDRLRVINGSIDIAAITALEDPLARLNAALGDLHATVDSVDSQWLVNPIRTRLATFVDEIADQQVEGDRAMLAVQRVPAMLGADGPRVYFVAFTNPAASRGLGGSIDSWAEVTIDAGRFSVTGFGRTADLAVDGNTARWSRITGSPDFPDVAEAIAAEYPAFSGHQINGVLAMDVYAVAALMKITGPIDLTSIPQTVSADNVATVLLSNQFAVPQDGAEIIDPLAEVAQTTIGRLLTSSLPNPPDLVELMSPLAAQGRLDGWSALPDEQDLFRRVRMAGQLPAPDGGDGLSIAINNTGDNTIDYYLSGEAEYSVDTDPATDSATATLDITLHNAAPAGVLEPAIVFGNTAGAPPGTNVMELTVYSALPVTSVSGDGQPPASAATADLFNGYNVTSRSLQIPAKSSVSIHLELAGPLDLADGYHGVIRIGPGVSPLTTSVLIDGDPVDDPTLAVAGIHNIES